MSEVLPSTSPASVHDIFTDLEASVFDDSCGSPTYRYKGSADLTSDAARIPSLDDIISLFTLSLIHISEPTRRS